MAALTAAGEGLRSLLCPFEWSYLYLPVVPAKML
jgi:hypothetical protein